MSPCSEGDCCCDAAREMRCEEARKALFQGVKSSPCEEARETHCEEARESLL